MGYYMKKSHRCKGYMTEALTALRKKCTEEGEEMMAEHEGCTANAASKRIWDIRHALKTTIAETAREFGLFFDKIA